MTAGDIRLEVWSRPGSPVFERLIEEIPGPFSFTKRMAGGVGQGDMTVPALWDRINDVIKRIPGSPAEDVRTLNRAFIEHVSGPATVAYEWFNDVTGDESREDFTQIQGPGIESIMADATVYPWDWDGEDESTSTFPDWVWGGKDIVGPVEVVYSPHIFDVYIDVGATGNFEIWVSKDGAAYQIATVQPGDSAFDVEQALEALANVETAEVDGAGTEDNPWRIRISAPAGTYVIAINSGGLTGGRGYFNLIQYGKLLPIGWTESRVGQTTILHGPIHDFRASLGGGSDPALPAGCSAWIVFDGGEYLFPGVQKIVRVNPNMPLFVPDDYVQLYALGGAADVRLIVRDLNENEICKVELSLVANTLTPVPGFTCTIPDGITEVVFRLGHIGTGDPPPIYMACPSLREGLVPTSPGGIMDALIDDATLDHVVDFRVVWEDRAAPGTTYLDTTFTTATDSAGVAWDNTALTFTAQRGKSYLQVLTDLNHLGYKWTVTPSTTSGRWNLNLYNPDWIDTDATALTSPAINIGSGVTGGPIFRSHQTGNVVTVEGQNMNFGRSSSAASIWAVGRREIYQPDRSLPSPEMATLRAVEEVTSRLLSGLSVSVTVDPVTGPYPLLDYDVDWLINVQIPPVLTKSAHRLASITVNVGPGGQQYKLAFSSESFAGISGTIEAVRRLMLKFEGLERIPPQDLPSQILAYKAAPFVIVAANDSGKDWKEVADFQCDTISDDVEIQAAIELVGLFGDNIGGYVILAPGNFYIYTSLNLAIRGSVVVMGHGAIVHATSSIVNSAGRWIVGQLVSSAPANVIPTFTWDGLIFDGDNETQASGINIHGANATPHVTWKFGTMQRMDRKFIYCDMGLEHRFDILNSTFRDSNLGSGQAASPSEAAIQFNDGSSAWDVRVLHCVFRDIVIPSTSGATVDLNQPSSAPAIIADNIAINCTRSGGGGFVFYRGSSGDGAHDNWINGTWTAVGNG